MPLADLLGMVAPQTNDLGFQFARPDYGAQIVDVPTQAVPQAPVPVAAPPHGPSKLRNFLGLLGDALYRSAGGRGTPMYERMQQQQALQGFLTNPDQAIAQLMQVDAPSAISLYKAVHPASETPDTAKLFEYRQKLTPEQRADFDKVMTVLHPGMIAPITLGPNDTYEPAGEAPAAGEVTATGPNGEKVRLNPATNQWEPMGGPTPSASGGFL